MLDITATVETKKLIDKLVHTENKDDIADIVKKLVPYATDFEVMRFANYRGYFNDYVFDEIMDIEKKSDRIKYLDENNIDFFREEFINVVPYIPLTEDDFIDFLASDQMRQKLKIHFLKILKFQIKIGEKCVLKENM